MSALGWLADLLGYKIILNNDGTEAPQRKILRFVGATAVDNPVLGTTDVIFVTSVVTCAFTSPSPGASVGEGAIAITGTMSAPVSDLSLSIVGGAPIGSATIDNVALTWSYTWVADDTVLGARTIRAVATPVAGGVPGTATLPVFIQVPLSFWSTGGYWDLRTLAGVAGDSLSSPLPSAVGANSLTPVNNPSIDDVAIGGRRAIQGVYANSNYLRCDALAPRFTAGNTWSVAIRYRSTGSAHPSPLWSAGHSTTAVHDFFQVEQINGTQKLTIISDSVAGGTITRTGTTDLQYDEHILIMWCDGTSIFCTVDGAVETLDNALLDTHPITMDRFAIGGVLSTAASNYLDGYVQVFAMSYSALTSAKAAALYAQLRLGDFVLPRASSKSYMFIGDSITETSVGTALGAGIREYPIQWIIDNGLSLRAVGLRSQGTVPDRMNEAQGGANSKTIGDNAQAAYAASVAPDVVIGMMGTNDMSNPDQSSGPTGALGLWKNAFDRIYNGAVAANPSASIIWSTITALEGTVSPGSANVPLFNTALTTPGSGAFAVSAAGIAGRLRTWDGYASLGAWSGTYWSADTTHPNELGCQTYGAAFVAANGLYLRSLSPTIVPLTCVIKSPSAGSTLHVGTSSAISVRVSRYPSTVTIKKGATVLGSAVMTKLTGTFSWTPVSGDLGAQSLTAIVTDSLDSSTATSAAVSVTVAAALDNPLVIWGAAVISWKNSNLAATTGGMADQAGTGIPYTGTCSVNAVDATLNNLRTISLDGNSQQLTQALTLPTPGTTPTCRLLVAKHGTYAGSFSYTAKAGGNTLVLGPISSSQVFAGNGTNQSVNSTFGVWQLFRDDYSNDPTDVQSAGANTHTGNSGNSAPSAGTYLGHISSGQVATVLEEVLLNRRATGPELTRYYAYLDSLTASGAAHP